MYKLNTEQAKISLEKHQLYKRVFSTDDGQRVLFDLMSYGSFLSPTHVPGDEPLSHQREGMRRMVLYIVAQLEKTEKQLLNIIREEKQEQEKMYVNIEGD